MVHVWRHTWLVAALGVALIRIAAAQTEVESRFLPPFGLYSEPANWSPAEVPNDTPSRHYNVTLPPNGGLEVDTDATISNLIQGVGLTSLHILNQTFTVKEKTQTGRLRVSVVSNGTEPSAFNAGKLSSFFDGALTGEYELQSYDAGPATLQFFDAQLVTLRDAHLSLSGAASNVLDENDNDALRNLAEIDVASTLALDGRSAATISPLRVDGTLELGGFAQAPTIFTASASLTNFDPDTRTLLGGSFALGQPYSGPDAGPTQLRFPGADIVNNGSSITLVNDTSRITDLAGLDGLRNLARNLPDASLNLWNRVLVAPGNFTNDGTLTLEQSSFTVIGTLTNFDPATRTLQNGSYQLAGGRVPAEPALRFAGAEIVHNGAFISLSGEASIADEAGNDALRDFTDNLATGTFIVGLGQEFTGPADFTNAGRIETYQTFDIYIPEYPPPPPGAFKLASGATYTQTAGATLNNGIFTADRVEIAGGSLAGVGAINGNVTIADATVDPGGVISGDLTLSTGSRVHSSIDEYSSISSWRHISGTVVLAGRLEIEIKAENFLSSEAVLTLLHSAGPVTGSFNNAPDGTRITTVEGSGSFVVKYETNGIALTDFRANPPPAQLLNISTRGYVKRGDDPFSERYLIGGFIITGAEPKTVVVRGLGPSLGKFGLGATLADPTLALHDSGERLLVSNDNWKDTQQAEIEASGLAPENQAEAAIHTTLTPGAYTVVLQEKNGSPGNSLVEVYDLTPNTPSKLGNISTRGSLDSGNVLIGGIIAGGEGEANAEVVVRALGPQLRRNGVFTAVEDPTLELRDGNGSLVAFNDNWFDNDEQFSGAARDLTPSSSTESAMRLSLPRGHYTAIVRAKENEGGTALVEFYDLRR